MLTQPTLDKLRRLRLVGMAEALTEQMRLADYQALSFEERLGILVDREWTYRQDRRQARLLKEAKLRLLACPEEVDYQTPRGLDRALMNSLFTGQWITQHQNVLITGPTGVGKTFIACALAQ
ncbi:MAG: ATP-binding protein, partial [Moorellales bacterium]